MKAFFFLSLFHIHIHTYTRTQSFQVCIPHSYRIGSDPRADKVKICRSAPEQGRPRSSPIAGHASPSTQPHLHQAQLIDGALEGVSEHGTGKTVDDWVQSTVKVGKSNGQAEELRSHVVRHTVPGSDLLDIDRTQACGDAGKETQHKHSHDQPNHPDGPPNLLLLVQLPLA